MQLYIFLSCFSLSISFCTTSVTHQHTHIPPLPPFSLLGSLPWQRGQTSCDSAVVCRMHSAQGPQALDDNQPNLSHRFSTAWKIHRTICQTWNGLLHCLEFHCCPQTTSLNVTQFLLLGELTAPFIISTSPPFCSAHLIGLVPLAVCWSQELGTVINATRVISDSCLWWSERQQCWWK